VRLVDRESVTDELYLLPRDEFTAARNAAAARASSANTKADETRASRVFVV
jgi:hypothetical protein